MWDVLGAPLMGQGLNCSKLDNQSGKNEKY